MFRPGQGTFLFPRVSGSGIGSRVWGVPSTYRELHGTVDREKKRKSTTAEAKQKAPPCLVLGQAMSVMVVAKMGSLCHDAQLLVGIEGGGSVPRRWVSLA